MMLCRTHPWPEPVSRAFRHLNEKIYVQMQGKSEFLVTGNLKEWERWDRLHEIKIRVLTIGSRYDEMDPDDMKKMATLMPNASWLICPRGSHLCMWDDQTFYFENFATMWHQVQEMDKRRYGCGPHPPPMAHVPMPMRLLTRPTRPI